MKEINLAEKYNEEVNNNPQMTVDEFFDKYNIPKKSRTDFGMSAIVYIAKKIRKENAG